MQVLAEVAPAGHYLALKLRLTAPTTVMNRLPRQWVEHYSREGLLLADPVMGWIYAEVGVTRWSDIRLPDPKGVLAAAREHGLKYGVAVSLLDRREEGGRSFGLFLREDREFADSEMGYLQAYVVTCHEALRPPQVLTSSEIEALQLVKAGYRIKQISLRLGTSEAAVKQRLGSARRKLGAKTGFEAISRGEMFGLI
ncbi:helix-turn-helix transcriptional regulator [Rubellimicrobium mesophilum]|nr:LuxR family transcriptional regulator [Rubellimicrobium mesophilum]